MFQKSRWGKGFAILSTGAKITFRKIIPIARPAVGDEELRLLREVIDSGWLTQGPMVAAFEHAFAERHGVSHAIAVTSCTTGLHLTLASLGIGPGDEVIVPAFTWISTANAVLHCGATPVLVDVDPITFNIDTAKAAEAFTNDTRAIIPVHLFGLCADVDALKAAMPNGVAVVEDAACAAGAHDKGLSAGAMGTAGVFSFHPRKSITTGEGGMITTNDDALAEVLRQRRDHGATVAEEARHASPRPHQMPEFPTLGFNYRMSDLQGAVGRAQLAKLDRFMDERADGARRYRAGLAGVDWLRLPEEPENGRHGWQAFVVSVDPETTPLPRNDLMDRLQAQGIATRPGTHAVHMQAYYREKFGFRTDDFPGARDCAANSLALPLHNYMTDDDYDRVIGALKAI